MRKVLEKIKTWGKDNCLVLLYFLFAVLIEMTAVFVVEGTPFLSRPFLSLGLLLFICGILLLVKGNRARAIVCTVMLVLQVALDLVFSVIFDMTDQYFDIGMLNLRNDAFAILESIPIDFITFYVGLACCLALLIFGLRYAYYHKAPARKKRSAFFYVCLTLAGVATIGISYVSYYPRTSKDKYDDMLEGKAASAYSAYGMIGNLVGEVGKGLFQDQTTIAEEEINEFIYQKIAAPTEYFGVSKNKNVVVILAESFEWYTFLRGDTDYAGTLQGEFGNALDIPQETLDKLYPNLTEFYKESVVMSNFHGREKTDISETISILGSYPTESYVNYEYPTNTVPHTLPNLLKAETGGNIHVRSFHNGFKSFYNRQDVHPIFGFEKVGNKACPIDMYDMEKVKGENGEQIFYNYMDKGERNLDSQMIEAAKDWMFPDDGTRFYTYITTLTMHGMYYNRANLRPENNTELAEQLNELAKYKPIDKTAPNFKNAEALYYYMTTGLEFDRMLGCMKADLQKKGLWDKTVVAIFADHNAYYQEMSGYTKDIEDEKDEEGKFTDLYNVPFMIRDSDLVKKIKEKGSSRVVNKFTCTADIVPTLMDLLGIRYYENLYYGRSVFAKEESVLYSRAYGVFMSDGILRRSVKGKFYQYDGKTESGTNVADTAAWFEEEGGRLVEKIKYCDYIFKQDHFGKKESYQAFQKNMQTLNGWA